MIAVLAHQAEHDVAAVAQVIGMAEGIEVGRPAGQAGEFGGLREGDLAEILSEERFGGLAEAVNAEGAARAEVDLIGSNPRRSLPWRGAARVRG